MENQKRISVTETKLTPRQRPQMPPKLEMKSSQVILGDLSNSANLLGVDDISVNYLAPNTVDPPK